MAWRLDLVAELEALGPARMEALIAAARPRRYAAGAQLPGPREGFRGIHLVREGKVRIEAETEAGRVVLDDFGPGEALGIRAWMFPDTPPALIWTALAPTLVWSLDAHALERFLHGDDGEIRAMLEHAAQVRDRHIRAAVSPAFRALPPAARTALLQTSRTLAIGPGDRLPNDTDMLYFVLDGALHTEDGHAFGAGMFVPPSQAGIVQAKDWTEMLAFPKEALTKAAREHQALATALAQAGVRV